MSWQLLSMVLLLLALGTGMLWYERSRPPSQIVALVAVLAALAVAGRIVLAPIPNVVATTDIVIISGFVLGSAPGFAVGALGGLVSNFWLGQGVWTPWQMVAWGMCGIAGGVLFQLTRGRINRWWLAAFCGAAGLAFGAWMNLQTMVSFGGEISLDRYLALEVRAIPFDTAHMAGNVIFALVAGPAMIAALTRFRDRFEWTQVEGSPAARLRSGTGVAMIIVALSVILVGGNATNPQVASANQVGNAKQWLSKQVNDDGGFGRRPGMESNLSMTTDAMIGLGMTGKAIEDVRQPGGKTPMAWLMNNRGKITNDGSNAKVIGNLAKSILAMKAVKKNPRNLGGMNLVKRLDNMLSKNFTASGRVNTAAYAAMALRAVGKPRSTVAASEKWICRVQNTDGGWGSGKGASSDVDSTGISMLVVGGSGISSKGIEFLRGKQANNGGFSQFGGSSPNSQSTSMAIQGMLGADFNIDSMVKGGFSPLGALKRMQQNNGAVRQGGGAGPGDTIWATAQALPSLAERPLVAGDPRNCADFEKKKNEKNNGGGGTGTGGGSGGTSLPPGSMADPYGTSGNGNGGNGNGNGGNGGGNGGGNYDDTPYDDSDLSPSDIDPGDVAVPLIPDAPSAAVLAASQAGPQPSPLVAILIALGVSGALCGGTILLVRRLHW